MFAALLLAALPVAYLAWTLLLRREGRASVPLPPGPKPLPLIGNVHQAPSSHPWRQYHAWSKVYGPVFYLNMLGQPVVILSTATAAHEVLSKRGATFSDRPHILYAADLALKGLNMLLMQYDDMFRTHSRLSHQMLSPRAVRDYAPQLEAESSRLLLELCRRGGAAGASGADVHPDVERAAASMVYALSYGFRAESAADPTLREAVALNAAFSGFVRVGAHLVDTFPLLNRLPRPLAPWKATAEAHFRRLRAHHLTNFRRGLAGPGWNLSKQLRAAVDDQPDLRGLPLDEQIFQIGTLNAAALDGTAETLMWFLFACVTNAPAGGTGGGGGGFVGRAQACLDAVVGRGRLPGLADRPALTYLDAVVEETLRWRPVGAAGVPHFTRTGGVFDGFRIPPGSVVIANHWAITRDEAAFGPDVDAFVPERWLADGGGGGGEGGIPGAAAKLKDLPSVGFGYGRRLCPGRHLASDIVWIVVARLLWAFDMGVGKDASSGADKVVDPDEARDGLVMRPPSFDVTFKPRGSWVEELIRQDVAVSAVVSEFSPK